LIKGSASSEFGEHWRNANCRKDQPGCSPCCAAGAPDINAAAVELSKVRDISACENVKVLCVEPGDISEALLSQPSGSSRETLEAVHVDHSHVNARSMQKVIESLARSKSLYRRYAQLVSSQEINEIRS